MKNPFKILGAPFKISEAQIQQDIVMWMNNNHPITRLCFFHIPNGGYRSAIEGVQFQAKGVIPGVPDLIWVRHSGLCIFFEVKTGSGKLSDAQVSVHDKWKEMQVPLFIVRSLQEFTSIVEDLIARNGY